MRLHARHAWLAAGLLLSGAPALGGGGGGGEACLEAKVLGLPTPGFEEETGRDLRQYPPHRVIDVERMSLDLRIADMNARRMEGVQRLTFRPMGLAPVAEITLDANRLRVESIGLEGREVSFEQNLGKLMIRFSPAIEPGRVVEMVTSYAVEEPEEGLVWTTESESWPGRPPQIHTQGQPQTNSYWFPCIDFPSDRMVTQLRVTVPAGYEVLSNGRLESKQTRGETTVFNWMQEKPHVAYLVSMVIGKFDIVDVGTRQTPMPVYAPLGRRADVEGTFGRTKEMVALFERLVGVAYPWEKYAQAVLWNFGAGGMENTSATSLHESAIVSKEALLDHDPDGLIAHELAHQWFGDLVTCNSWEHIWLNEGFATYFESLWLEHRDGLDAYYASIQGDFDGVIAADRTAAPDAGGMASKIYSHPWETFRRVANPYGKGASVLHMLRTGLGDELFFKGVALYLDRRALKTAETTDLRTALEDVSGKDLRQFFHQWVTRPQIPRLDVVTRFTGSDLEVTVTQNQVIDGDNPAFEFALPVGIADSAGNVTMHRVAVTQKTKTARIPCAGTPLYVAIDPALALLAECRIRQPVEAWREQALRGPTLPSRVQALRALKEMRDADSALLAMQVAQSNVAPTVRVQAVSLLGEVGRVSEVVKLASADVDRWEVREAACRELAEMILEGRANDAERNAASRALGLLASRDPSTKVRGAALVAATQAGSAEAEALVAQALRSDSQDDRMRHAGLDATAIRKGPGSLKQVIALTGPQYLPRTRAKAAGVVVQLADQDRDAAFATLDSLVRTSQVRGRTGAGQALVDLGDERALATFDAILAANPTFETRWRISGWKAALRQRLNR